MSHANPALQPGFGSRGRRGVLALIGALPASLCNVPGQAQPRQLDLASYFHGEAAAVEGARRFAERATRDLAGTIGVSLEVILPWVPFPIMSRTSALAHYCAPEFARIEPVFGLSALPMLTATFDEAETLLRIAKPSYSAALARHGQILLASQPWRPVALWSNFRLRSAADFHGSLFPMLPDVGEHAGWGSTLVRLGARRASLSEAEFLPSRGFATNLKYTQEFAFFSEVFLAVQLNFLTVSRRVFDSLAAAQQQVLVAAGREIELSEWKAQRDRVLLEHQEIVARGVLVAATPPDAVVAALRTAAEPDIQGWAEAAGEEGRTLLSDYRRAVYQG